MINIQPKIKLDTWIELSWENYIQTIADSSYEKAKFYYYNGQARIEMSPVGNNHADNNGIISFLINLFALNNLIPIRTKINCSYRKAGLREAQPDISYYLGEKTKINPNNSSPINLDTNPPPDLVIEIADTSLADDFGIKRILYEDLKVGEYWVVDVEKAQIVAFKIMLNGSERITKSEVLPELEINLLEQAMQMNRESEHTEVGTWFLSQIQTKMMN